MIFFKGIKTDDSNWSHFDWTMRLNGVDIDYKTGVGHARLPYAIDAARCIKTTFFGKPKPLKGYKLIEVTKKEAELFVNSFNLRNVIYNVDNLHYVYVKTPRVRDILHSLYVDYSCGQETFEDFCSNYGYDTDSRKALKTYLACQESGSKLRKIMKSKNYMERIAAWEL